MTKLYFEMCVTQLVVISLFKNDFEAKTSIAMKNIFVLKVKIHTPGKSCPTHYVLQALDDHKQMFYVKEYRKTYSVYHCFMT